MWGNCRNWLESGRQMSTFNIVRCGSLVLLLIFVSVGGRDVLQTTVLATAPTLTEQQIASLATKKIFFGHQSVGNNIVQGMRDLMGADPHLKINIVKSADPQSIPPPAFVEFEIGRNGDPRSKTEAFTAILDKGMGSQGGIAMFKYCYVDINSSTNVQEMFEDYRAEIDTLKAEYPALKIVHITVPLTTVEPTTKAWIKSMLGRTTTQDVNVKRNEFNNLLRKTYSGIDPIFDLAQAESTQPDGIRSYFTRDSKMIYTLASEFTTDGGHLNEAGRQAAAAALLEVLAKL
jgi:lysophospholipase L1-like esterase